MGQPNGSHRHEGYEKLFCLEVRSCTSILSIRWCITCFEVCIRLQRAHVRACGKTLQEVCCYIPRA